MKKLTPQATGFYSTQIDTDFLDGLSDFFLKLDDCGIANLIYIVALRTPKHITVSDPNKLQITVFVLNLTKL